MKIAINGFGRIGRQIFHRIMKSDNNLDVVAINDLTDSDMLAHLFEFDSTYGRYPGKVEAGKDKIVVDGKHVQILAEKDPSKLPWKELGVELVLECTGFFCKYDDAMMHVKAGAKRVIISAPCKGDKPCDASICMGVNEDQFDPEKHIILSNASCTTNCLAPMAKVLQDAFGIEHGIMTTIHAVTNDQRVLDLPHKDYRRARSCIQNIIPTTTGAAKAVGEVLPELKGKLTGMAIRVPTPTVSLVDLTAVLSKEVTPEEVNKAFEMRAKLIPDVLQVEARPLVSKDFQMDSHSCSIDAASTQVIGGNLVKVLAWYDNEWGYSCRMVDLANYIANK